MSGLTMISDKNRGVRTGLPRFYNFNLSGTQKPLISADVAPNVQQALFWLSRPVQNTLFH